MAVVWPIRGRTERQGHQGLPDSKMQGIRIRNDDQLRRSIDGYTELKWVCTRQPSATGFIQDQQNEDGLIITDLYLV